MSYIFFIILLVSLIHQNSRIGRLEQLLKNKKTAQAAPDAPVAPQASPVLASISSQPIPQAPIPQAPVPEVHKDVSEEEVSGRILGRIGIGAVVLGVGFFLKYAFDNNWIEPAGRVLVGIVLGIIIMGIGQMLRKKYLQYSDLLMGGGLAVLYISIFSAHAFYHLIDPMMAFMGMAFVTAVGVVISIINATKTLSVVALIGGFLTPFLIGFSALPAWVVFTYTTVLNVGTLAVLMYKKWPQLTLVSLIGTWAYFGIWFVGTYTDELMVPTLIFVIIQFLILTASSLIRIIIEKAEASEMDYFVLMGTALGLALTCYSILLPDYKHFASAGSVIIAAFYVVISLIAYRENPADRTINIFLPGLAVTFLTIAVPIEFSGPWIAAWWFIESLVLYVIASKSSSRGYQIMGVVVYMLGLVSLMNYIITYTTPADFVIFFNGPFVMVMLSVVTAYAIAFIYHRYGSISQEIQQRGVSVFAVLANFLTIYGLTVEIGKYYDLIHASSNVSNTAISIFWALYASLLIVIGFAKKYASVRRMGLTLFIITAFKVVINVWSLGELYRIISFIAFGIIALVCSFIYVRYRDRLKDIV